MNVEIELQEINEKKLELMSKVTDWLKENNYLTEAGDNVKTLSDTEVIKFLKDLEDQVSKIDRENGNIYSKVPDGKTIIPYTDGHGNLWAWQMADNVYSHNKNYAYVSNTPIGAMIMDRDFAKLLRNSTNRDKDYISNLLWGTQDQKQVKSQSPILDSSGNPIETSVPAFVDYLSDRVMSQEVGNAKGDIFAIVANSQNYNVFIRTEFNTLIHNEDVTSINGIPREDLLRQYEKLTEQGLSKNEALEKASISVRESCQKILDITVIQFNMQENIFYLDFSKSDIVKKPAYEVSIGKADSVISFEWNQYMKAIDILKTVCINGDLKFENDNNEFNSDIHAAKPLTVAEFMTDRQLTQEIQGTIDFRFSEFISAEKYLDTLMPEIATEMMSKLNTDSPSITTEDFSQAVMTEINSCADKVPEADFIRKHEILMMPSDECKRDILFDAANGKLLNDFDLHKNDLRNAGIALAISCRAMGTIADHLDNADKMLLEAIRRFTEKYLGVIDCKDMIPMMKQPKIEKAIGVELDKLMQEVKNHSVSVHDGR